MKTKLKRYLGPIIIIATVFAFVWYVRTHPEVITQLKSTPPGTVAKIVLLYIGSLSALVFVLQVSLWLYHKAMPYSENFLLTAYSSIVNFFGPGQSGPGVRAVYLKMKHGFSLKRFMFVTLIYFAWFAFISGIMFGAAAFSWWITMLGALGIVAICTFVIWHFVGKSKAALVPSESKPRLVKTVLLVGLGTFAQIVCITAAYYVELRAVDPGVSLGQAMSYTGAANFALFVSVTPGAIGIREAFLLFSQNVHGISTQTITAASILDRAVYFVVLALLGLLVLTTHASTTFRQPSEARQPNDSQ